MKKVMLEQSRLLGFRIQPKIAGYAAQKLGAKVGDVKPIAQKLPHLL